MDDGTAFQIINELDDQIDQDAAQRIFPITAAELLRMDILPRETLLTPWLPRAGAAMLYAPRGIGKTYLSLSVAYAVASGGQCLRWQTAKPARVLFIDGEMPLASLQERLAGIAQGAGSEPPSDDFLRFLPADHFRDGLPKLTSPEGLALIKASSEGTDLIVLDNLSSLATGRENEADDWQPMQDLILSLRRRKVSTLIVHHAGKGGQQRGTSRREDVLDTVLALKRPDDYDASEGARFEVHFEKARGFTGADALPFEAKLITDAVGASTWSSVDLHTDGKAEAFKMFANGAKAEDVARTAGVSRPTAFRWQKDWREGGGT
jgi:putative DNA primase/helicase